MPYKKKSNATYKLACESYGEPLEAAKEVYSYWHSKVKSPPTIGDIDRILLADGEDLKSDISIIEDIINSRDADCFDALIETAARQIETNCETLAIRTFLVEFLRKKINRPKDMRLST